VKVHHAKPESLGSRNMIQCKFVDLHYPQIIFKWSL